MPSIEPILIEAAGAMTRELLEATKRRIGRPSNMRRTMAHSPSVLEAYLHINHVYEQTRISTRVRGLITAAIAQALGGDYIFSVAVELAAFEEARRCESNDPKIAPPLSSPYKPLENTARLIHRLLPSWPRWATAMKRRLRSPTSLVSTCFATTSI